MKRNATVFLPPSGDSLIRDLQNLLYLELGLWSALALPAYWDALATGLEDQDPPALPLSSGGWIQDEESWGLQTWDARGSSCILRLAPKTLSLPPLPLDRWEEFTRAHPVPQRRWNWGYRALLEWEFLPNGDHWDWAQWSLSQRKVYRSKPVLM